MLVIDREVNEWFDIILEDGREIAVLLHSVKGRKARFGIAAPRDIKIIRRDAKAREPKVGAR